MDDLDISQLAAYLHLNPDKVVKMATRGKLPGRRVGGQWRFSKAEIHHWLERQIGASDADDLERYERVVGSPESGDDPEPHAPSAGQITIAELLPATRIAVSMRARTRGSVIRTMCELATTGGMMWDAPAMATAVESREQMHPTALDCGVALLHPRRPQTSILAESVLALGVCPGPIPFTGDGQLVDVFWLICSYDDREHLPILARISRLLTTTDLLTQLRQSETANEAHHAVVRCEQSLKER